MKYTVVRSYFVGDVNEADWTREAEDTFDVTEILADSEEAWEEYDEMLDEVQGEFMGYYASDILKNCDPIAYRCGFSDYWDSRRRDIEDELEGLEDGEEIELYGYTITAKAIEEEVEETAA